MMHVIHPCIPTRKNYDNEDRNIKSSKRLLSHGIDQDELQQQMIGKGTKKIVIATTIF
jgi:hypothetical protein